MAASCSHVGAVNTAKNPVSHIVEEKSGIDRMNAIDIPPEEYYDALRADMESRHPKADKFVMDHAMSLEAFLDKAIAAGFSFGIEKAQVLVIRGKLLGHWVAREGASPDPERVQAIMDFAPLKDVKHIQQFLGCCNWLRIYMLASYAHAAKVLGEYQQEGKEWPGKGIGTASSSGCKAFRALKLMAKHHINLAVMDEEAAISGSRRLEQISDCSGYAWGGAIAQMTGDLTGVKMLAMEERD